MADPALWVCATATQEDNNANLVDMFDAGESEELTNEEISWPSSCWSTEMVAPTDAELMALQDWSAGMCPRTRAGDGAYEEEQIGDEKWEGQPSTKPSWLTVVPPLVIWSLIAISTSTVVVFAQLESRGARSSPQPKESARMAAENFTVPRLLHEADVNESFSVDGADRDEDNENFTVANAEPWLRK
ncbi:uncharacterized protein [Dermacentor albipictus]|uniref:uncharacterized protein n=1 Tax=Dermacentor albipictus TaxID=60249 RepID=UPI0038FC641C